VTLDRIGIDARKLGDTGVGRYTQSLLAGLNLFRSGQPRDLAMAGATIGQERKRVMTATVRLDQVPAIEAALSQSVDQVVVVDAAGRPVATVIPHHTRAAHQAGQNGVRGTDRSDTAGAALQALIERLRTPPTEAELARRRREGTEMDRMRVRVGREFDVASELRELRDRGEAGLPPDLDYGT
jgi:hypothetical protein